MLTKYKCELSQFKKEQDAIRTILNKVKKEWEIIEIVEKTPHFTHTITYDFEEGERICYFVKDDEMLFYCGPLNVRRKKLRGYTLWSFDYCFYLNGEYHIARDISYMWDTLSLNSMPEDLIFNPCVVADVGGQLQIVKAKKVYNTWDIQNVYIVNMMPNEDKVYNLKFIKNGCEIRIIEEVREFEPSILFPGKILYKEKLSHKFKEYDFIVDEEGHEFEYTESHYRRQEENDFWHLMNMRNNGSYLHMSKMNKQQYKLFDERVRLQTFGYYEFYFAVSNAIAEIVVENFFAIHSEVKKLPSLFEEDFSHNYLIRIEDSQKELLYLWLYFCKEQMVTEPCVCGIQICKIIRWYRHDIAVNNDEIGKVVDLIEKNLSPSPQKVIELFMKRYPYKSLLSYDGDYLKYRSSAGKKAYLYVCDNLKALHSKYVAILQDLVEQGKISPRWKSEFSLYMLVKSYFPNAIYQYRSGWLMGQSLDIFIPDNNVGIEYQGIQHYEPIDIFGGQDGLNETQKRDMIKREKCKENNILLIEWNYSVEIKDINFINMLRSQNISIPKKKYTDYVLEKNTNTDISKNNEEEFVIYQYNLNGDFLSEYSSVFEASKLTNIQEYMIRRACTGIRDSAGGYQWRKVEVQSEKSKISPVQKKVSNGSARKIIQLNLEGETIATYGSIAEAVRLTGINSKSIRDAANGKQNHAGGYKWKYEDAVIALDKNFVT